MLGNLIKAQILENLYGVKFIVTFVIVTILVIGGTISGIGKYDTQLRDESDIITTNEAALKESGSWWRAANTGQKIVKPATRLVLFSSGLEESVGRTATVKEGDFPQMEDSIYSTAPIFAVFGDLDLTFIIKIVISLFAILFTYDLVSGEKERGTLKLCLSNSVPRNTYLLGKTLGSFISMLIPLVIPLMVALLIALSMGNMNFSGQEWARVGLIFLGYMLYMLAFFCIGLFVSTVTKHSAVSFLVLLFLWVLVVLIVPKGAMLVANQVHPIPTVNEVRAEQLKLNQNFRNEIWQRTMEEIQKLGGQNAWGTREGRQQIFAIRNQVREELEPDFLKRNQKLVDDFKRDQNNLTNLAISLSRISPASAVTYIGMNLAGTGYAEQENFLDQLTSHRSEFTRYIENEIEKENDNRAGGPRHGPTAQGELDISGMPDLHYQRLTVEESIILAMPDLAALLLISLVFYLLGFVMFLRYDVR